MKYVDYITDVVYVALIFMLFTIILVTLQPA